MKKKIIYQLLPLMCCCIMTSACDVPEYSEQAYNETNSQGQVQEQENIEQEESSGGEIVTKETEVTKLLGKK